MREQTFSPEQEQLEGNTFKWVDSCLGNLQNISRIFVNLSRGGSWQVESPAARFGPLADVSLGPHGVDLVVGELE